MRLKEFVNEVDIDKPAGKIADQIKAAQHPDARAIARDQAPRPGGRRIGPLPTGQVYPTGDAGASPAELGKTVRSSTPTPGMDKVNQALKGVDVNKLNPAQKKNLIAKINDVLKSSKNLKKFGTPGKILAILGTVASAGLEMLDPSIAQAANEARKDLIGSKIQLNESIHQVISLDGNILTVIPEGGEQQIRIDITGWVLVMPGHQTPILRDPKSPVEKDRSLPPGSTVDIQGQPRIIGTPKRG
jgi:hypothetical protein